MSVLPSPTVTKEELERLLSKQYEIGRLISFTKLKKGLANALYRLRTTKGDFTFKIAIRNNPVRVRYEIDLLNHLYNLPIPQPVKTKGGKYLVDYQGHKSFIYPFLPGKQVGQFTPSMLSEVGQFLGKLHCETEGFTSSVKRLELYAITDGDFEKIIATSKKLTDSKIKKAVEYLEKQTLKYQLPKTLPQGAMHIDLKPENTLFDKKKLSGVVDFDNSYIGPLVLDLANTMMWFCSRKGRFDAKKARLILKGYMKHRKLSTQEQYHFFEALHYAFLSHVLIDIYYLALEKLPKDYIMWGLENLLKTEKQLPHTKEELQKIIY